MSRSKALPSTARALIRNTITIHFPSSGLEEVHLQIIHQKLTLSPEKKKKEKRKSSPKKDLIMLGSNRLPLFLFPQFNALLFPQTIIFTIFLNPVASNTNHFVFLLDSTANCLTTSQSLPENASNMRNNYLCRVGILPNMHQK